MAALIVALIFAYGVFFILKGFSSAVSVFGLLMEFGLPLLFAALVPYVLASSLIVKRFHDLGRSGVWWWALLIPVYNIYLAIGLLTERGNIGSNEYGEDPVESDSLARDFLDRFVGKSAVGKLVVLSLLAAVWVLGSAFHPQTTPQQGFNAAINQALTQQAPLAPTSSSLLAYPSSSTPSTSTSPTQAVAKLSPGWKAVTVAMATSPNPTCYTIDYPSYFTPSKYNNQPGDESFLRQDADGFWNGVTVKPDFSDKYDSFVQQQEEDGAGGSITTNDGATGIEVTVPAIRFWEIFIPVSQRGVNYFVSLYPEDRNNPYDPSVAEAMAKSLTFACEG